jgi:selenocysteine-specific elongation factor
MATSIYSDDLNLRIPFIVGTAGHIDHGKSSLVKALTGTDPDRLKEEKERGITIELGFAHLDLGDGRVASFIDVPGHERFVRHMLAGAHGIDAVVLVVAADESVMPQTREHFHICRLLGIGRGLVALTKCDAADPELQALAELEIRELVAGSFLEGAPVVRVSARTGEGLPALLDHLRALASQVPPRDAGGVLRLPVDRAFTLRGFGTVVTGTLRGGRLAVGDEVEVMPSGLRSRVRGLHVHGSAVGEVGAGSRAAVNLAGLEVSDLERGDVVGEPGTLLPSSILDVRVTLLADARSLKDQARVRVHAATAEVLARLRLVGSAVLQPGATAPAQLRLERPTVVGRGDRLVLRSYSPADTIGGAVVLDPVAPRRRSGVHAPVPAPSAPDADPGLAAAFLVAESGERGVPLPVLATRLTMPRAELRPVLEGRADVVVLGEHAVARSVLQGQATRAEAELQRYHAANPLRADMPREELRARVFAHSPAGAYEEALAGLQRQGKVRVGAEGVALTGHEVRLSGDEEQGRALLLQAAAEAGLPGLAVADVARRSGKPQPVLERVARVLQNDGHLCRVGDVLVDARALAELKARVRTRFAPGTRLEVGVLKDMTGLSRKFVIPLLEFLDREKVTRRAGVDRVVLGA